jgi:hypothetical protein
MPGLPMFCKASEASFEEVILRRANRRASKRMSPFEVRPLLGPRTSVRSGTVLQDGLVEEKKRVL